MPSLLAPMSTLMDLRLVTPDRLVRASWWRDRARSFSLGHSNNHVGEMTALLEAAQHLLANPPLLPVVFFIDSTTTINIAEGR